MNSFELYDEVLYTLIRHVDRHDPRERAIRALNELHARLVHAEMQLELYRAEREDARLRGEDYQRSES